MTANTNNFLTLTILTACRNAAVSIVGCLDSIDSQLLPKNLAVEHLILDGVSEDDTLSLIASHEASRQNNSVRRQVISGRDNGFYDALNKGLSLATGNYVGILNADDFYADSLVLQRVVQILTQENIDGCYGDLVYLKNKGGSSKADLFSVTRYWKSGSFSKSKFLQGWMPPHPTVFLRREIYQEHGGFRLDLGSAADYELMLRFFFKENITLSYIPHILVGMRSGGMSNVSVGARLRANGFDRKAWIVNGQRPYPWTLALKPLRKLRQWFNKAPKLPTLKGNFSDKRGVAE